MPKETITYMSTARFDSDPKFNTPVHGDAWAAPALHVGWAPTSESADGDTHLIIEVDPRYLHSQIENYAASVGEHAPIKIVTDTLNRADLNKLIRSLRTARDRAYGRDE